MLKLYSDQNSLSVGLTGIMEKIRITFFSFFLWKILSWTSKYGIYKFSCKNSKIVFWSKFLVCGTNRRYGTNLNLFFFSYKRFFQLCIGPLNILSTNFCTKNAEIVLRSKFMVSRTMGHYGTNLNLGYLFIFVLFYFYCERFFQLCLGPLNILTTSFRAKPPKSYFG